MRVPKGYDKGAGGKGLEKQEQEAKKWRKD